jgi:hypothetical protein
VLLPDGRIDSVSGHAVSARSVVMHRHIRQSIMIKVIHQQQLPRRGSFGFEPGLRHREGSHGESIAAEASFGGQKRSHRSHDAQRRQGHGHQHLRKRCAPDVMSECESDHDMTTRPVRLTVTIVRRRSRS